MVPPSDDRAGIRTPALLSWLRLARAYAKISHAASEHLRGYGLSMAQFDVLAQLGRREGISQQELAHALLVSKGNICQLLDRMERDGLLRRCQSGRSNRLVLTDEGRRLAADVVPAHQAQIAQLFSTLTTEEQVQILDSLRKLDHALDRRNTPEEPQMATPTQTTTTATTWQIDPKHSLVEFAVKHMMITTVRGRFGQVSGTIVEDSADFGRSSVQVEIDAASIDTREEQRDGHLKSPDFLHVQDFPAITFKSTAVIPGRGDQFQVVGDLTIHGVTRPLTLEAERTGTGTNPWGAQVAGFSAETKISRKDFGLSWNVALEAGGVLVGDQVKISLEIQAVKQG
jgi:polyisoprenoid-binding protein YceI